LTNSKFRNGFESERKRNKNAYDKINVGKDEEINGSDN
jgi:hypothetical protein